MGNSGIYVYDNDNVIKYKEMFLFALLHSLSSLNATAANKV